MKMFLIVLCFLFLSAGFTAAYSQNLPQDEPEAVELKDDEPEVKTEEKEETEEKTEPSGCHHKKESSEKKGCDRKPETSCCRKT